MVYFNPDNFQYVGLIFVFVKVTIKQLLIYLVFFHFFLRRRFGGFSTHNFVFVIKYGISARFEVQIAEHHCSDEAQQRHQHSHLSNVGQRCPARCVPNRAIGWWFFVGQAVPVEVTLVVIGRTQVLSFL